MKKRVWSLFLALALCLAMMPQTALAEAGGVSTAGGGEKTIDLDGIDEKDGSIKKSDGIARTGPVLTATDTDLCGRYYIVQEDITIDGDLTVDGMKDGGLVLAAGATLTINGALKHNGGNMFCIYGQTSSSGETGQLIIKNSKDDGAAIRTTAASASSTPSLHIYSGKVTIHGGRSGKLVEGVELYNGSKIHKGTLDGKAVSPAAWTSKSVIEGNTLVLAYCDHDHATYTPEDETQHKKHCADCGFVATQARNCNFDGAGGYVAAGEEGHYQKCVCGNTGSEKATHMNTTMPTEDGTKHTSRCKDCGYTLENSTAQDHTYVNGKCSECGHVCSHSGSIVDGKCSVCGMTGIKATIGSNAYTEISQAVTDWLDKGGTLTLHANGGLNAITDFSSAKNKNLVIDLNGHPINCDAHSSGNAVKLNGVNLTIWDSKSKTSSQGAFGPINADKGTLTVEEEGYLQGLTVPENSTATIHLRDGKVHALICAKPVYTLLDDGYALMNGNITVDPTKTLSGDTQTYTAKNAQITNKTGTTSGNTTIGSGTLPFDLSLKTNDTKIGRVQFKWYRIKEDGTASLLAESTDVQPDKDGVYHYDTTTNGKGEDGWTDLAANQNYEVICVVAGKESKGAYQWQTVLKGYRLTIDPADLASAKTVITQQDNSGNTGNPKDNRLVVVPNAQSVGMSANAFVEVTYSFDVTYNDIQLELGKDYTIKNNSNKAKNAGAHNLTIEGTGNYRGEKTVKWTIEPYELPSKHIPTQIKKPYDGTTDGKNVHGKEGLGTFEIDSNNTRNPKMWTNITSIYFQDGSTLSNMHFDAAEAGDRTFYFTLTLKTDNFVFAGGEKSAQFELKKNGSASPYINKVVVAASKAKELQVANKHAATYTVDLAGMLPQLNSPMQYGEVTYALGTVQFTNSSYYDGNSKPAKIENGKLILPIKEVDSSNEGEIGKVTVTVSSTNYRDFTLTINVNAVNKIIPALDGKLTLSKEKLTYGEQLSTITLSGAMTDPTDGSKTVAGTFAWAAPETAMNQVGDYQATWKFTPVKGDVYAETTGTVAIPVEQAVPTGTPLYKKITASDKTLADAKLKATEEAAEGTTAKSCFTANGREVAGTIKWVDKDGNDLTADLANIKVVQGESYKWLFTPTDQNYKELSGAIVLWAKPSSGGFVTPAPVNPDVITVKEETKDNSISKPGAETGTTTTTKTTVKTTTTETTKNEQGQDVSKTTASVSKDLGDKLLDQAVTNKSDRIEIAVKSSDANNSGSGAGSTGAAGSVKATEVKLPKATVNSIAKDTNADLVIKTDNGEVVLDNKTLETIAGAAKGDTVTIVVGENTQLKETQKPAEKIVGKNGTLFDLAAKIGEKLLHQFEGGKAHVTLPMPEKLKGKDLLVIYIDDNGLCKILNHSVAKIGAEDYIRFTTTHFSTFAVVDKNEAERLMKEQNAAHVKELMQSAKFKVTTTKTSKKSVKVQVAAKSSKTMISDIKSLGYTIKYQFYRSTKKTAGYKVIKTKAANTFTNTKSTKGTKYYYKARVLVYDGKTLVAKSALRQCGWGSRTWIK